MIFGTLIVTERLQIGPKTHCTEIPITTPTVDANLLVKYLFNFILRVSTCAIKLVKKPQTEIFVIVTTEPYAKFPLLI